MKRFRFKFTLIELLVSLGVFSIMLVLFMQFFSGMQKIWSESDNRGQLYNQARIAMDLISKLLNATVCSTESEDSADPEKANSEKFFFRIYTTDSEKNRIYFTSCCEIALPGTNNTRFYSLQIYNNKLMLSTLTNASEEINDPDSSWYSCFFAEYYDKKTSNSLSYTNAFKKLKSILDNKIKSTDDKYVNSDCLLELLPHITKFEIKAYKRNGESVEEKTEESEKIIEYDPDEPDKFPIELEIRISMLGDKDYLEWQGRIKATSDKKETDTIKAWRSERERTFVRRIFLGDRCSLEEKYEKFPL